MRYRSRLLAAVALICVPFGPVVAQAQHPWEPEILAFEAQDRASPPPLGSVVITGSSTIMRWSTIRTDLAPLETIPRGFGGSTTDDLDYYLERIVLIYQPRAVVIYEGDNDISGGRTAQYVADRVAGIIARITARLPATRVYVISIKPSPGRWSLWPTSSAANQLLAAFTATDARYTFINAAPALLGTNDQPKPEYYSTDGLHLNAAGYQAWTNAIRPVLLPQQLIPLPVDTAAPTQPTGVTATTQSPSRIDLRWKAASDSGSGLAGYSVFRNGARVGSTTTLNYSDTGLTSNTLYSYTITAFDRMSPNRNESAQSAPASATTPIDPNAPPTVSLQANPTSVAAGGSTQLSWSSTNATSCTASGGWSGARVTSGSMSSANLFSNSTFTLTCTGSGGMASASKSVTVMPAPTVTLTASPSSVPSGSATQLSWTSTNASSCTASGSWSGAKSTSGSTTSANLFANATFTLACTGTGGTVSYSKSVTVLSPPPTVSLTVSSSSVVSGSVTQLSWTSTDATACTASGNWSGAKATSGSATSGNLSANATFVLTCAGPGGNATASSAVKVLVPAPPPPPPPPPASPTVSFIAGSESVAYGGVTQLSWTSTNATICSASGAWSGSRSASGGESTPALTSNATFSLSCSGPGGDTSKSVSVAVAAPPAPTATLTASPTSLDGNGAIQLSWSSSNAIECTASGGWSGNRALSGTESSRALTETTVFDLDCSGPGGTSRTSAEVMVAHAVPSVTLTATPATVVNGTTAQLSWTTKDTSECVASGSWNGQKATAGDEQTTRLNAEAAFGLSCSGPGGNAFAIVTVKVAAATNSSQALAITATNDGGGGGGALGWWETSALATLLVSALRRPRRALSC